jgi:predicted transcriptional regulator
MRKSEVLEIVNDLADDADVDIDRLIYTLYVRREIDRGLADADAGREVSLEEIDLMIDEWPE